MTMTVQSITKHLIVQKYERMSYRTDTAYILYKTLVIFGMQPFFSKSSTMKLGASPNSDFS